MQSPEMRSTPKDRSAPLANLRDVFPLRRKENGRVAIPEIYRIYPAIRRVFCPSRMTSNN